MKFLKTYWWVIVLIAVIGLGIAYKKKEDKAAEKKKAAKPKATDQQIQDEIIATRANGGGVVDLTGRGGTSSSNQRQYVTYCKDGLGNITGSVPAGSPCPADTKSSFNGWA